MVFSIETPQWTFSLPASSMQTVQKLQKYEIILYLKEAATDLHFFVLSDSLFLILFNPRLMDNISDISI